MLFNSDKDGYVNNEVFDYCIIGAGPAGITTALNLDNKSSIFLAEGGSTESTETSKKNYDHASTVNYFKNDQWPYRLRYFGGTSNHWGGNVYAYNREDVPINYEDYLRYEDKAKKILEIKHSINFSIENKIKITHYARSYVNFGDKYLEEIKSKKNIFGHLKCNLINLKMNGDKIDSVTFSNYKNEKKIVRAKKFIFAMGSFENIRMMLFFFESNNYPWKYLLGKNWTDHFNYFYSGSYFITNKKKIFKNNDNSVGLSLGDEILKKNNLPQAIIKFDDTTKITQCNLPIIVLNKLKKNSYFAPCWGDMNLNFDNYTNGKFNSIKLSSTKKCRFNIPALEVYNSNDGSDLQKIKNYLTIFAKLFAELDLGRIQLAKVSEDNIKLWSYHQMMGSPIGNNSSNGVVDENLKVFGIDNLFTVGGNIFNSTLSGKNPTLMITVLSVRLANYLNSLKV